MQNKFTRKALNLIDREKIYYVIFGVLTTIFNFAAYLFFSRILALSPTASAFAAWFVAVLFAYFTNRIFVFQSVNSRLFKECVNFYAARIFTGLFEVGLMWLLAEFLGLYDIAVKLGVVVFIVILNYLFSKFWVFKQ